MAAIQFLWTDSSHVDMLDYQERWFIFTYDDGALYIDCEVDGVQKRVRITNDTTAIKEYINEQIANSLPNYKIQEITQDEYDALTTPDENTLYVIPVSS